MNAIEAIDLGLEIFDGLIESYGFQLVEKSSGKGSGGPSAWAKFEKRERSFEFHYRYGLGQVIYSVGDVSIHHRDFVRSLTANARFPNFASTPSEAFEALKWDVANHTYIFFNRPKTKLNKQSRVH